jgi:hypothetical protein
VVIAGNGLTGYRGAVVPVVSSLMKMQCGSIPQPYSSLFMRLFYFTSEVSNRIGLRIEEIQPKEAS